MTHRTIAGRAVGAALTIGILSLVVGAGAGAAEAAPTASLVPSTQVRADDTRGPQFYAGSIIDVSGTVDGDVYAAGQSVTISGDVDGDVIAAAQSITITGTVDGDVRLAAQTITVSGEVARSATLFASDVNITSTGSIGRDVVGAAATTTITGDIGRDVQLSVGRLTVDGTIGGDLTYTSDNEAQISEGAVTGSVERIQPTRASDVEVSPWVAIVSWFFGLLYALVALSIITVLAGLLMPRWLHRVTDHLVPSPWKALLVGFIASIAVPIALFFLLVTIVGAPLALAGLLVWTVLTMASFVYGAYYIGRLLFRGRAHPVIESLVGGVILIIALQIPWLNIVVWLAMVFFGVGAQLLEFSGQRPWSTKPPTPTPTPAPVVDQPRSDIPAPTV
ncbi:bactofilin family protein [Herbiconiux ginsengi]|uniref:DUF8173 domain-containing protein n=1 Tax=Herbiconiux ginsengi TaxID=381665 RepID=A0A1H3KKZ5_9MICO|nr:polymer-forming cytoskeletal protein [Herbiconiux ginsengi]SDY52756.1 hypothetical protein SAMN05216554_0602 [Herbiconiux ginsengi]